MKCWLQLQIPHSRVAARCRQSTADRGQLQSSEADASSVGGSLNDSPRSLWRCKDASKRYCTPTVAHLIQDGSLIDVSRAGRHWHLRFFELLRRMLLYSGAQRYEAACHSTWHWPIWQQLRIYVRQTCRTTAIYGDPTVETVVRCINLTNVHRWRQCRPSRKLNYSDSAALYSVFFNPYSL